MRRRNVSAASSGFLPVDSSMCLQALLSRLRISCPAKIACRSHYSTDSARRRLSRGHTLAESAQGTLVLTIGHVQKNYTSLCREFISSFVSTGLDVACFPSVWICRHAALARPRRTRADAQRDRGSPLERRRPSLVHCPRPVARRRPGVTSMDVAHGRSRRCAVASVLCAASHLCVMQTRRFPTLTRSTAISLRSVKHPWHRATLLAFSVLVGLGVVSATLYGKVTPNL